jgi:hypothetical protein
MKTNDEIAIKYFDVVLKDLTDLVHHVDEDCPVEYRSDHLQTKIEQVYDLIESIAQESLNADRADEQPPIIEL